MGKKIFFPLLALALVLLLLFLTASTIHHEDQVSQPSVTADNCDITTELDAVKKLSVTPHLIAQFYHYYGEHSYELTYLPEFSAENKEPDRDALSLYILLCYEYADKDPDASIFQLSDVQFQETMQKHMLPVAYTDGPTRYLSYENGLYTTQGFDLLGADYYRLASLTRDDQGVYTAIFDILHFAETEPFEPETSPNMRSLLAYDDTILYMNDHTLSLSVPKFNQAIEALFLQEDYASVLDLAGQITIQFTLTGDAESPFYYISCARKA